MAFISGSNPSNKNAKVAVKDSSGKYVNAEQKVTKRESSGGGGGGSSTPTPQPTYVDELGQGMSIDPSKAASPVYTDTLGQPMSVDPVKASSGSSNRSSSSGGGSSSSNPITELSQGNGTFQNAIDNYNASQSNTPKQEIVSGQNNNVNVGKNINDIINPQPKIQINTVTKPIEEPTTTITTSQIPQQSISIESQPVKVNTFKKPVLPSTSTEYIDTSGQGVSYDPLKSSLGSVTVSDYKPTNFVKSRQQEVGQVVQANYMQVQKQTPQKPIGILSPAPTIKEQFKGFIKKEGVVEGSLLFAGSKLSEVNTRFEQSLMQKVPGYKSTQIESTASLFQIAPQTLKFTSAGPAIFVASGAEALGTSSGRERIKEQEQSLIMYGKSPLTAKAISYGKPVLDIGLGLTGLKGQREALASTRTTKLFEEAPTILKPYPESYRVSSGSKGYDVLVAEKNIAPNFVDKVLGVKPTTYKTQIVQPYFETEQGLFTSLEGGEGVSFKIIKNKPTEFVSFESGGRIRNVATTPKAVYPSKFAREFEAEASVGRVYTKTKGSGDIKIIDDQVLVFYDTAKNAKPIYQNVLGVSKQLENEELLIIGGEASKARLRSDGVSVLGKPEVFGKLKVVTKSSDPVEVKFITPAEITKTPLSKTFGATVQTTKQSSAGYIKSLTESGMKPVSPVIKSTTILEKSPQTFKSLYYGTGTYERYQPSENIISIRKVSSVTNNKNINLGSNSFESVKGLGENTFSSSSSSNRFNNLGVSKSKFNDLGISESRLTLSEPIRPKEMDKLDYGVKNIESLKSNVINVQRPIQKEIQLQKPRQNQIEKLFTKQTSYTRSGLSNINIINTPIKTPTQTKVPITPFKSKLSTKETSRKPIDLAEAYKTFIIRRGKKEYLKNIGTKAEAVRLGEQEATKTLAATFGVEKTGRIIKAKPNFDYRPSSTSFRDYKIKSGKKTPLKDTWIQKAPKRLSARTEVSEIISFKRRSGSSSLF